MQPIFPSVTHLFTWDIFFFTCDTFSNCDPFLQLHVTHFFKCSPFFEVRPIFPSVTYFIKCDPFLPCVTYLFNSYPFLLARDSFFPSLPLSSKCDPFSNCDLFFEVWPILLTVTHFFLIVTQFSKLKCDPFFYV